MSPLQLTCVIFACIFGGAVLGLFLGRLLPEHHMSADTKDAVKLGMGLVATMAALVLGLLVASAEGSYDAQRGNLIRLSTNLGQTYWLLFEEGGSSISTPLLVVVVLWLTILFCSFGVFAPRNLTVVVGLFVSALSVAGALFLILEMDQPFTGMVQISDAPLRRALAQLGR